MPEVILTHLHSRRTGITRHVEDMARALPAKVYGSSVDVPLTSWSALWSLIRTGPAIWHAHRNNELLLGLVLKLFAKKLKVVFTRHSATEPGAYSRWLMRRADRVLTLTELPHGVDLTHFAPPPDRAAAWRALAIGGDRGIGVIGRIRPDKGQAEFADAMKQPPEPWRAVMIGLAKDIAWARSLGVRQIDEVADPAPWYRGLTIVVQPSHQESFGLVLIEAMAAGCCVVAADLPHYHSLLEHGRTGFFYPVGDAEALKATLAPLLADPTRADAIGAAAAEHARTHFGVAAEAAALRTVYDGLFARPA